jgi:hypothetical protein
MLYEKYIHKWKKTENNVLEFVLKVSQMNIRNVLQNHQLLLQL